MKMVIPYELKEWSLIIGQIVIIVSIVLTIIFLWASRIKLLAETHPFAAKITYSTSIIPLMIVVVFIVVSLLSWFQDLEKKIL